LWGGDRRGAAPNDRNSGNKCEMTQIMMNADHTSDFIGAYGDAKNNYRLVQAGGLINERDDETSPRVAQSDPHRGRRSASEQLLRGATVAVLAQGQVLRFELTNALFVGVHEFVVLVVFRLEELQTLLLLVLLVLGLLA